jgi:hypothetical protein
VLGAKSKFRNHLEWDSIELATKEFNIYIDLSSTRIWLLGWISMLLGRVDFSCAKRVLKFIVALNLRKGTCYAQVWWLISHPRLEPYVKMAADHQWPSYSGKYVLLGHAAPCRQDGQLHVDYNNCIHPFCLDVPTRNLKCQLGTDPNYDDVL